MNASLKHSLYTLMIAAILFVGSGCSAHTHVVGNGAQTGATEEARQWYILWGLVPINDVDTSDMAAGAEDYTIETEQSALDVIINIFTGIITVYSRTVTVTK